MRQRRQFPRSEISSQHADSVLSNAVGNTDASRLRSALRAASGQRRIAVRTGEPRVQRNRMLPAKISAVQATLTHYHHAAPRNNQHCVSAIMGLLSGARGSISTGWERPQRAATARQQFPESNQALRVRVTAGSGALRQTARRWQLTSRTKVRPDSRAPLRGASAPRHLLRRHETTRRA
jgi:hypothetical protein